MSEDFHGPVQTLWLDACCSVSGTEQHNDAMRLFLREYIPIVRSLDCVKVGSFCGKGKDVLLQVCKDFSFQAQFISDQPLSCVVKLIADELQSLWISVIALMTDRTVGGNSEETSFAAVFKILSDYNVAGLTVTLHRRFQDAVAREPPAEVAVSNAAAQVDCQYLELLAAMLGFLKVNFANRCLSDVFTAGGLDTFVRTIAHVYTTALWEPREAELSLAIVRLLLVHNTEQTDAVSCIHHLEDVLLTSCDAKPERSMGRMVGLTCLMECLVDLKQCTGFCSTETLDFGALMSALLSLGEILEAQALYFKRLLVCVETLALTPRAVSQAVTSSGGGSVYRKGILRLVPAPLNRLQEKIVGTLTGETREAVMSPDVCRLEAVESLTTLFICVSQQGLIQGYGELLFFLLGVKGTCDSLISYVITSCLENLSSLQVPQLDLLLQFMGNNHNSDLMQTFSARLAHGLSSGAVASLTKKCLLLEYFISYASASSGHACASAKDGILRIYMEDVASSMVDDSTDFNRYVERFCVLAKVTLRSPTAVAYLKRDCVAELALKAVLRAHATGLPHIAVILRDLYTNLLVKTGQFYDTLTVQLAASTATSPWKPETSVILAIFVATLQTGKHIDEAVRCRGIELSFALLYDIGLSKTPECDIYLIGCCLSFMLPAVCYSDVWDLFDSTVGVMERTTRNIQLLIDLSCGYLRTPRILAACALFFEAGDAKVFGILYEDCEHYGPYHLPVRPFCALGHPLQTLVDWASDAAYAGIRGVPYLASVIEALLDATHPKLSNVSLVRYVRALNHLNPVRCISDISHPDLQDFFFGYIDTITAVRHQQDVWLSLLQQRDSETHDYNEYVEFAGDGGASGTLTTLREFFPGDGGLTVGVWVYWDSLTHTGFADSKVTLWQLQWTSGGIQHEASFSVSPKQTQCVYTYRRSEHTETAIAPYIEPGRWLHVVLCHSKDKVLPPQVRIYFDGRSVYDSPARRSLSGALQAAAVISRVLPTLPVLDCTCSVSCTVGSPEDMPNGQVCLRVITFAVYDHALSPEEVLGLYCAGPLFTSEGSTLSGQHEVSMLSPYLGDDVMRALEAQCAASTLGAHYHVDTIQLSELPDGCLLHLSVQSMVLVDAPLTLFGNRQWAFTNLNSIPSSLFRLHGRHSPLQEDTCDMVDALLLHGAMFQWARWMKVITACAAVEGGTDAVTASQAGHRMTQIIATANKQTVLSTVSWRRFGCLFSSHVADHAKVYLSSVDSLRELLSLAVKKVPYDNEKRWAGVVYYTIPLERLFFNWKVMSHLTADNLAALLDMLEELIHPSNPFREFNARRFYAADFVNGFLYGLIRVHVAPASLRHAMRITTHFLLTLYYDENVLSDVVTLCAHTVPTTGSDTGGSSFESRLMHCAFNYVVLVRNGVLLALGDMWEQLTCNQREEWTLALTHVLPRCWFTVLTSAASHPVSVALSMRLFVACYVRSEDFRLQYEGQQSHFLSESLTLFPRQRDILDVLFYGFLGHVWRPQAVNKRVPYGALALNYTHYGQPMLHMALSFIKRQSQLILRDDAVAPREVGVYSYFAQFYAEAAASPCRRRLRGCIQAALFCVRLKRQLPRKGIGKTSLSDGPTCSVDVLPCTSLDSRSLKQCMVEAFDWLASHYHEHDFVRHALYQPYRTENPIDFVAWPLLCALYPKESIEVPVVEQAEAVVSPDVQCARLEGEDEDQEKLPAVVAAESRSYGLDRLIPREDLEDLFDSCRSLYLAHATEWITSGEYLPMPYSVVKWCAFVWNLHRALSTELRGVGNRAEDWRTAFLCTVWLKAAEQAVDCMGDDQNTITNALALGKYVLDRLVSGSAAPPGALANFCRFVLERVAYNEEVGKIARTILFEWMMYITSAPFHKHEPARAGAVIDMVYGCQDVLFKGRIPSADILRTVTVRLMELSHTFVDGPDIAEQPTGRKLAALWRILIRENAGNPVLASILGSGGSASQRNLFHGGFDLVLSSEASAEAFLHWIWAERMEVMRRVQKTPSSYDNIMVEGGRYLRLVAKMKRCFDEEVIVAARTLREVVSANEREWRRFTATATSVDQGILDGRLSYFAAYDAATCSMGTDGERRFILHPNDIVILREVPEGEDVDYLDCEPVHLYLCYAPPNCIPLRSVFAETVLDGSGLRINAAALLRRITGPLPGGHIHWIGNVYFLVGGESVIATLVITQREVLIISCSEVTQSGDFFIAQVRSHTAAQKSHLKTTFVQETLRRLMRGPGTGASAAASKAAFRFSQYYRQLRTEALQGAQAMVWRFAHGTVAQLHQRLFQHMQAGLEFVLETGERYFVVVLDVELSFSQSTRDKLQHIIEKLSPHTSVETFTLKTARLPGLTRRWVRREVSNRRYLDALNDTASRSIADMGQYPVMPWVLQDYDSTNLDLGDERVYRDMSKPVGALHNAKAEQLRKRYAEWVTSSEPPFHYGTHYSSSAIVMYYLVRLHPFTTRSARFQGGKLDLPDRLFHSVAEAWSSSSGPGSGDVKELIPQFFSLPTFLLNANGTRLGTRSDGETLHHVILPPWAQGRAECFTHANAAALEGDVVSENLCKWIDLIFGYKQRGDEAVKALNQFSHLSYRDGVERAIGAATSEEDRKSIVASVDNFGQTPYQLFAKLPHPRRLSKADAPSMQQHLFGNFNRLTRQAFPYYATPVGPVKVPVENFSWVDGALYAGTGTSVFSSKSPVQCAVYNSLSGDILYGDFSNYHYLSRIPPVTSFGCGMYVCMSLNASGNLLCVGTSHGSTLLFNRDTLHDTFRLTGVLHPPQRCHSSVHSLTLFPYGQLIVCYSDTAMVSGWQTSSITPAFSFSFSAILSGDASPVQQVTWIRESGHYCAVKRHVLFIFSHSGVVLSSIDLKCFNDRLALPQHSNTVYDSRDGISIAYCNCDSFDTHNMLLVGHENGVLSSWNVEAVTQMGGTPNDLYHFSLHSTLPLGAGIRAILPIPTHFAVSLGLENGAVAHMLYPTPHSFEE